MIISPIKSKVCIFCPFIGVTGAKVKRKGATPSRRVKIWPLCSYERKTDGTVRYRGPSPLWFEDYLPNGFEKAWLPLLTMFDYSSGPQGKKTFSMLGPLYQYKQDQESLYHRLLIFSYKKVRNAKQDMRRFSVLGGLFEYAHDQGESGLRFFYLPPLIKWGEKKSQESSVRKEKIE